jgi:hypothetical protein
MIVHCACALPFPLLCEALWVLAIYYPVVLFTLVSLACVSCRDPGLMERVEDEEAGEGGWFWNEQVGSFRPPGALYCRECGVLIQDYDHLYVSGTLNWRSVLSHPADSVFPPITSMGQVSVDWYRNRSKQHACLQGVCRGGEYSVLLHNRCCNRGTPARNRRQTMNYTDCWLVPICCIKFHSGHRVVARWPRLA